MLASNTAFNHEGLELRTARLACRFLRQLQQRWPKHCAWTCAYSARGDAAWWRCKLRRCLRLRFLTCWSASAFFLVGFFGDAHAKYFLSRFAKQLQANYAKTRAGKARPELLFLFTGGHTSAFTPNYSAVESNLCSADVGYRTNKASHRSDEVQADISICSPRLLRQSLKPRLQRRTKPPHTLPAIAGKISLKTHVHPHRHTHTHSCA